MPQIKFEDGFKNVSYNEIPQANKMRWQLYKQTKPNHYEAVTGQFKCKDFFNDVVAAYQTGEPITVYRFEAKPNMVVPGEPAAVMLYNMEKFFLDNWNNFGNPWLKSQGIPQIKIEFCDEDTGIAWLPPSYFENTFDISAVTLLIRALNYFKVEKSIEELKGKLKGDDNKLIHILLDKTPVVKRKKGYIWYYQQGDKGYKKGDKKEYTFSSMTHNCGISAWLGGDA